MAADLEKKARDALVDDNLELAIDLYTKVIAEDPKNADLYADRAQAQFKLGNYNEAVEDADLAIHLDASMDKAYLRKGNACFKLGKVWVAKSAFEKGAQLAPDDARFSTRIEECHQLIALQQCAAENIPTVDNSSIIDSEELNISSAESTDVDSDEDTLTGDGLAEEWQLHGQKDVHFGPSTPEIRAAIMDKLILEVKAIKGGGSNSKKRLSRYEQLIVLNEVVKYMAINHRAVVSPSDIKLRVKMHREEAREIDELLKKPGFEWSTEKHKVIAANEELWKNEPYLLSEDSYPYYEDVFNLSDALGW